MAGLPEAVAELMGGPGDRLWLLRRPVGGDLPTYGPEAREPSVSELMWGYISAGRTPETAVAYTPAQGMR